MDKIKVAYICVHNSCRSQMAEAITKKIAGDIIDCYSGGSETKAQIDQGAVNIIKEKYGVDMSETQHPKLLSELPQVDVVVTMGCNVVCPVVMAPIKEDWGLADPTGESAEMYEKIVEKIEEKVLNLKERILKKDVFNSGN